ncbi:hypothetical protein [Sorangium sp. So ce341]|uniref:hypothetical protein n=1 Tax=Sorangium sp. So ce341 TaxID=3133302 RepID=UPI003F63745A
MSANGADGADGTKQEPLKSINQAIMRAKTNGTNRVYVCAEAFEEIVAVPAGVTIYGKLDCEAQWQLASTGETILTTPLTAQPGTVPLTINSTGGSVRIEDLHIQARDIDPQAMDLRGRSSIAMIVEGGSLSLVRCVLEAGNAAPGATGRAPDPPDDTMKGQPGSSGNDACMGEIVSPKPAPRNECDATDPDDNSRAGLGGNGSFDQFDDGGNGAPGGDNGGSRQGNGDCGNGGPGMSGGQGRPGSGGKGIGKITSAGYQGDPGMPGQRGKTGQGGGGGAGGMGENVCMRENGGASGGSGGTGGCGGAGGAGGEPGGSSIALLSIDAKLTFQDVRLIAKAGGNGGSGASGQSGGEGGEGGPGGMGVADRSLSAGCAGGKGGNGGQGGKGGGGQGGHSIGIAYRGTPPPTNNVTIKFGTAGEGGQGDDSDPNDPKKNNGDLGKAVEALSFDDEPASP